MKPEFLEKPIQTDVGHDTQAESQGQDTLKKTQKPLDSHRSRHACTRCEIRLARTDREFFLPLCAHSSRLLYTISGMINDLPCYRTHLIRLLYATGLHSPTRSRSRSPPERYLSPDQWNFDLLLLLYLGYIRWTYEILSSRPFFPPQSYQVGGLQSFFPCQFP